MRIEEAIGALRIFINDSSRAFFSAKVSLDPAIVLELVDKIEQSIPEDIRQARWILKEKQDIVAQAERDADALYEDKQAEAQQLLQEAKRESQRLLDDAEREKERMLNDAQEECEILLSEAEITRRAERAAHRIVDQAKNESRTTRLELETYIEGRLDEVQKALRMQMDLIKQTRDNIIPPTAVNSDFSHVSTEAELVAFEVDDDGIDEDQEYAQLDANYEGTAQADDGYGNDDEEQCEESPRQHGQGNVVDGMAPERRPKPAPPGPPTKPQMRMVNRKTWPSEGNGDETIPPPSYR